MTSLEQKHLDELLASTIDKGIIALNFKSLDGEITEEGCAAADHLLYAKGVDRNSKGNSHYLRLGAGWWCGGGIDFRTFDLMAEWGCFKADEPRLDKDGKPLKYEHPPSVPTEYFALRVTFAVGAEIAQRYGLSEAYSKRQGESSQDAEDKGFWGWAISQKSIPLLITEGAKKAACLLSHGYLSIAISGIWNACESGTDTLKPGIAIAATGREVVIVFDSDSKEKTKKAVNSAAVKLSSACILAGSEKVTEAYSWKESWGKGVDDLISNKGVEVFDSSISDREEVKELPKTGLQNTHEGNPCPACKDTSGKCTTGLSRTKNKVKVEDGVLCASVLIEDDLPDGWEFSRAKSGKLSDVDGVQRGKLYPIEVKSTKGNDRNSSDDNGDNSDDENKGTIAERVLKLAFAADYFCTPDKVTYADIRVDGCRETHSIRSRAFRLWLTGEFYDSEGKAINSNAMAEALGVLDAKAVRSKVVREVNLRTAEHDGKIYLDLGSPDWSAVEIDAQGWRIVAEPPVRFTRPESLLALPTPIEGGSLDELKKLINVDGDSWVLTITFLLFSLCPNKTYPVLVLSAVRGSGKTAAAEILKGLIDPGKGGLIKLQNDIRNLAAAAVNRWLMVYDNVGYISADQSDDLCRMATNFGYSTRTLNTTAEETTLEFTRPQIITAIDALVTRDDLADRVLMAQLGEITEDRRLAQGELAAKVEAARPRVLGAMLTALSQTLAELPNTKPEKLPRMADYALFSIAAEKALGLTGEFLKVFERSREQSRQIVIESSPIGEAILKLMESPANSVRWKGTASQLLNSLESFSDEGTVRSKCWPKASNSFARQLNRLKPDIKAMGIEITETREGKNKDKFITLEKVVSLSPDSQKTSSLSSLSSAMATGKGLTRDDNGDDTLVGDDTFRESGSLNGDDTLAGDDMRTIRKIDIIPPESLSQQELLSNRDDVFCSLPDKIYGENKKQPEIIDYDGDSI